MNRDIGSRQSIFIIAITLLFLLYFPLFNLELDLRSDQINRGISQNSVLPVSGSDSSEYATLANNLLNNHTFSMDDGSVKNKILKPDTFRTIGYPLFISFLISFIKIKFIPLVQVFLVFITSYLIYLISKHFFDDRVGIYSSILFLLDPVTILNTYIILTDILYIFLIVLTFYIFICLRKNYKTLILSSFTLGLSTLVRPVSMFLLLVFLFIYIIQSIRVVDKNINFKKQIFKSCILFVTIYFLTISPWIIRNKLVSGVYGISTVKSYNIYHYYIPEYLSFIKHIDPTEARILVKDNLGDFDERSLSNAYMMQKKAFQFIKADPVGYGIFHLVKTAPFFLSSGIETSFDVLNQALSTDAYKINSVNITNLIMSFKWQKLVKALFDNPIIFIEQFVLLSFFLLALFSIYIGYRNKSLYNVIVLWVFILYFAILTGPVSYSRYRLQSTPFLFMLVVYTITHEITHHYSKSRQK